MFASERPSTLDKEENMSASGVIGFLVCIANPRNKKLFDLAFYSPHEAGDAQREFNIQRHSADAEGMRVKLLTVHLEVATLDDSKPVQIVQIEVVETTRDELGPPLTEEDCKEILS
jgi:hypothetical protein